MKVRKFNHASSYPVPLDLAYHVQEGSAVLLHLANGATAFADQPSCKLAGLGAFGVEVAGSKF